MYLKKKNWKKQKQWRKSDLRVRWQEALLCQGHEIKPVVPEQLLIAAPFTLKRLDFEWWIGVWIWTVNPRSSYQREEISQRTLVPFSNGEDRCPCLTRWLGVAALQGGAHHLCLPCPLCWIRLTAGDGGSAPVLLWCHLQAVLGKCLSLSPATFLCTALKLNQKNFRARGADVVGWAGTWQRRPAKTNKSKLLLFPPTLPNFVN